MAYVFNQVRLLVTDFPACFRFYRDVLGLSTTFGDEHEVYADFNVEGLSGGLALYGRQMMADDIGMGSYPANAEAQDRISLTFGVENVDAAVTELEGKGIQFVHPPTDRPAWGMRTAHFRDPAGNLLEIFHAIPMTE